MGMIKWLRAKAARARRHGDEAAKAIEDTANELSANSAMTDEAERFRLFSDPTSCHRRVTTSGSTIPPQNRMR